MACNETNFEDFTNISTGVSNPKMEHFMFVFAGSYMLMLICTGVIVNAVVIHTFRRHPRLVHPCNHLIIFLCGCDLSTALVALPFVFISCISNGWIFDMVTCQLYAAYMTFSSVASIAALTLIACQRCFVIFKIRHPIRSSQANSNGKKMAASCCVYGMAVAVLPFCGAGSYSVEQSLMSCSPVWWSEEPWDIAFCVVLLVTAFAAPLLIITTCYTAICIKVLRSRVVGNRSPSPRQLRLSIMSFIMIGFFFMAWGPYAVIAFLEVVKPDYKISSAAHYIPVMMAKSAVLWDPLIYLGCNSKFREAVNSDLKAAVMLLRKCSSRAHSESTIVTSMKSSRNNNDHEQQRTPQDSSEKDTLWMLRVVHSPSSNNTTTTCMEVKVTSV